MPLQNDRLSTHNRMILDSRSPHQVHYPGAWPLRDEIDPVKSIEISYYIHELIHYTVTF